MRRDQTTGINRQVWAAKNLRTSTGYSSWAVAYVHSGDDCYYRHRSRRQSGKYSIIRGEKPFAIAALAACSRWSFKSSEGEEMKTTESCAIAPPILPKLC